MRPALAFLLALSACFNGKDALGLDCDNDLQCGRGQRCIMNVCGGPQGDTEGPCPTPAKLSTCDADPIATPAPNLDAQTNEDFGAPQAVAGGPFDGADFMDLVVIGKDNFKLVMFAQTSRGTWLRKRAFTDPMLVNPVDLVAVDLDCNDRMEFLVLRDDGKILVLHWDEAHANFVLDSTVSIDQTGGTFSLAVGEITDDEFPDVVVAGADALVLVPNTTGTLLADQTDRVGTSEQFFAPFNVIVIGKLDQARVVVPKSNPNMAGAIEPQNSVYIYQILDGTFEAAPEAIEMLGNPWEVAEGDFVDSAQHEIAIIDRRLAGNGFDADVPGMLRFFTFDQGQPTELATYATEIGRGPTSLAAADLDCDDKTDLVIGTSSIMSEGDGKVQVVFGAKTGMPLVADVPSGSPVGAGPRMAVADFNGDGRPDVAIPDFGSAPGQRVLFLGAREAM